MPGKTPSLLPAVSLRCQRSVAAIAVSQALWLLAAGGATAMAPAAMAANASRVAMAIPAGTLEQVLVRFGQETGTMISYQAASVAGKRSAGLAGSYSVPEALDAIVAGSGLRAVPQANGGYVLETAPASMGQTMPEMTVTAAADAKGTTEGSGRTRRRPCARPRAWACPCAKRRKPSASSRASRWTTRICKRWKRCCKTRPAWPSTAKTATAPRSSRAVFPSPATSTTAFPPRSTMPTTWATARWT